MGLQLTEKDWSGVIAIIWILGFVGMSAFTVYRDNLAALEKIVALIGPITIFIMQYYFNRQDAAIIRARERQSVERQNTESIESIIDRTIEEKLSKIAQP
jgi:uncharacterized membrane protein YGL010W